MPAACLARATPGIERSVIDPIVDVVVSRFGDAYPELRENEHFVRQVAGSEEERFAATLRQGLVLFEDAKTRAEDQRITGEDAFKLSDTFGFPLQLTEELAAEAGLTVDSDRFGQLLEEQRGRARAAAKKVPDRLDAGAAPPSTFVGTTEWTPTGRSSRVGSRVPRAAEAEEARRFACSSTDPVLRGGGGQVGDRGLIRTPSGVIRVIDTVPAGDRSIVQPASSSRGR